MKRMMVWVLGLVASLAASVAFASATAVTVNGSVTAQSGTAPARTVRQGDTVRAGETVSTGPGASAVLRFEDGQVAALGQSSRMVIQAFEYNAQAKSGNIVLNLLSGGMRAITGLIGRTNPTKVTYRAGNYTIGIRGTDVTIGVSGSDVLVKVESGEIVFTIGGRTYTVSAGNGSFMRADGTVRTDVISAIVQEVQRVAPTLNDAAGSAGSVTVTVPGAGAGAPSESVTGTVTSTPAAGSGVSGGSGGGGSSGPPSGS